MVRRRAGTEIAHALSANRRLDARLVTTDGCVAGDASWHEHLARKQLEGHAAEREEKTNNARDAGGAGAAGGGGERLSLWHSLLVVSLVSPYLTHHHSSWKIGNGR